LGIRLAIDNFDADNADQINWVSQMPIQSIKIDRTIMKDLLKNLNNQRLISALVNLANNYQLEVVAQGVESEEQIAILQEQNIEVAQGFFLGNPVQANRMASILEENPIIEAEFSEE
jgi:EAL domain-containing protein (putative c-di-GMP-specific phosphodiesterase class I)